jgi:hypothetical protein
MTSRRWLLAIPLLALVGLLGPASCPSGGPYVAEQYLVAPGTVEPHTPGSGVAGVEMAASADVQSVVGASPDLNRVSYLRTYLARPDAAPPRAILILVPGFLSGAGPFALLAEKLVAKFNGNLEVWAVDRRPNQLEDRRGSEWALQQLQAAQSPAEVESVLEQAVSFYLPESPGVDLNGNGMVDPPLALPDALGGTRSYVRMTQDDMRFAAYWGVDTYVRDWKLLADEARSIVGPQGLVLFGGHSLGTYWATVFAAYDFDPDPAVVDAGYQHIDGIVLLEGGGGGDPSASAPDLTAYQSTVASLAQTSGPDVFLQSFQGIEPALLGPGAEMAGLAGVYLPDAPSVMQRSSVFRNPPFSLFFNAPTDNRSLIGFFLDDDFQPFTAFRASLGFSSDGTNTFVAASPPLFQDSFYIAGANGGLRHWMTYDDPGLPTCPPNTPNVSPGCALLDNGPRPAPTDPPKDWGHEVEVTDLDDILRIQYGDSNFVEWYYLSGRTGLDGQYGLDSSALVAQSVAATGSEGPLVVTQNANVDVPVLCIGGSNGLAPTEGSFSHYLGSIATPPADEEVDILEGYAHIDVLTARHDGAVPLLTDWINRLMVRKLLAP